MELIFLLPIIGACLIWLAYASARRVEFGAALFLFITYVIIPALNLAYTVYPIFSIGGITFYQQDPVMLILLLAFIFRLLSDKGAMKVFPLQRNLLIVFIGLVGFSILLGVVKYGQGSPAEARRYMVVIAPLVYFASFKYTDGKLVNLVKMLVIAGALISVVGFIKWLLWGGQLASTTSYLAFVDVRETISIGANGMIVLTAWLILMVAKFRHLLNRSITGNFLLLFLFLMLIMLQERTLWVIAGCYLVYFLLQYNIRFLPYALFAVLTVAVLVSFLYVFDLLHIRQTLLAITIAFQTTQGQQSTLAWRYDGWAVLLKDLPPENYFFGLPFGSGYNRMVNGVLIVYSPHNFYIDQILRIGVIGMLAYVISHLHVLVRIYNLKRSSTDRFTITVVEILALGIVANLIYSITFNLTPLGGALWGLAVAVIYSPIKFARVSRAEDALSNAHNDPIPDGIKANDSL